MLRYGLGDARTETQQRSTLLCLIGAAETGAAYSQGGPLNTSCKLAHPMAAHQWTAANVLELKTTGTPRIRSRGRARKQHMYPFPRLAFSFVGLYMRWKQAVKRQRMVHCAS